MEKRVMLTNLQLRILKLIVERRKIPTSGEIADELNEYVGSVQNSLNALMRNRNVIREFAEALFKAEEAGIFEKPKSDWRQLRVDKLKMRSKQGYYVGKAPFGCRIKNGVIEFIPEMVPKIQRAFQLRADGWSHGEIKKETGIPATTLPIMFRNPVYCGKVRYEGRTVKGQHKGIISEKLSEKVQPLKEGYIYKDKCFGFKVVQGRLIPKEGEAEKMKEMFLMRLQNKSFGEIDEHFKFKPGVARTKIINPKYAAKKLVNGKFVNDPYITEIVDFEKIWKPAQDIDVREKFFEEKRKIGAKKRSKVWNALPGTYEELTEKTGLTIHQVKYYMKPLKHRVERLQDARWYPKDELVLLLHRKLREKGWKTLLPPTTKGIETRDKILHLLLDDPTTQTEISRRTKIHPATVNDRITSFTADGLVEKGPDRKYYINEENAKFLRTVQAMFEAVRRQYA